mmetsp:Transcript_4978/g.9169  ORF Transcript_4978/g.9169 Transcript_4978/m.9169 type:complete len:149 (+) Transcript_4978:420-866(+)
MKLSLFKASLALNAILGVLFLMTALRGNTLGAAPVRSATSVKPMQFMKSAAMAGAVGGLSMYGATQGAHAQMYQQPQPQMTHITQNYDMASRQQFDFSAQAPQLVAQNAEVTPSLSRYFKSVIGAGVVVGGIGGALAAVAKFDQIQRS